MSSNHSETPMSFPRQLSDEEIRAKCSDFREPSLSERIEQFNRLWSPMPLPSRPGTEHEVSTSEPKPDFVSHDGQLWVPEKKLKCEKRIVEILIDRIEIIKKGQETLEADSGHGAHSEILDICIDALEQVEAVRFVYE